MNGWPLHGRALDVMMRNAVHQKQGHVAGFKDAAAQRSLAWEAKNQRSKECTLRIPVIDLKPSKLRLFASRSA
jgi:hypothetical protein